MDIYSLMACLAQRWPLHNYNSLVSFVHNTLTYSGNRMGKGNASLYLLLISLLWPKLSAFHLNCCIGSYSCSFCIFYFVSIILFTFLIHFGPLLQLFELRYLLKAFYLMNIYLFFHMAAQRLTLKLLIYLRSAK